MDPGGRRLRMVDGGLIAALLLQLALWIFSQGKLWQAVEDVRQDVHEIKRLLLEKAMQR